MKLPGDCIAGRPMAALLLGSLVILDVVPLFIVIPVILNIRKVKYMLNVRLAVWEIAFRLAIACDDFDGVFSCCPFAH